MSDPSLKPGRAPALHSAVSFGVWAGVVVPLITGIFWLIVWASGRAESLSAAGMIVMKTNMAAAQVLAGASLAALVTAGTRSARRWLGLILAGAVFLVGAVTLGEYAFGWDAGIDQLLAKEAPGAPATTSPNRMGLIGASSLVLAGASLLTFGAGWHLLSAACALALCALDMAPAVGYVYGIRELYSQIGGTGVAWSTVAAFLALGVGLLLSSCRAVPTAILLRDDAGGSQFRRYLPAVLALPLALGFVTALGQRLGVYDPAFGAGLLVILLILTLGGLSWRSAIRLSRSAAAEAKSRAELAEHREWLRVTLHSIGDAVITCDTEGRVSFLNGVAEEMTGWKREEALGKPLPEVFRIINERTGKPTLDPVAKVLKDKRTVALANHTALVRRDGRTVPIEDSAAPILDDNRELRGVVLVFHDVTEKRQAEERIETERNLLQSVIDSARNSHLAYLDRDFNFVRVNETYARSCGYSAAEMIGRNHFVLYPHAENEAIFRQVRDTGRAVQFYDKPFAFPDQPERGVTYWDWTLEPARDDSGQVQGLVFSLFETTQRKKAQEALRTGEARFRLLADVATRLLKTEDPQTIVDHVCAAVLHHLDCDCYFNYLVEEPGRKLQLNACAGIPPEEAERIRSLDFGVAVCGCVARDGKSMTVENIQARNDDMTALVRQYGVQAYCCHPLQAPQGVIGTLSFGSRKRASFSAEEIAFMESIADQVAVAMQRLEARRALQAAKEKLAQANVALERKVEERTVRLRETITDLEQFSYSIAHDLRAPLRSMSSFASILLEDHSAQLDADGIGYLRRISAAARRMDELIRDVLTYSRVVRSDSTLAPVDLDHLVREIVDHYPQFSPDRVEIKVEPALAAVAGNPALLTQCVSNLLGNAAKFVPPGVKPEIRVWTERQDGWVRVNFQDNGIGIDASQLDRIWRIFERAHDAKQFDGTGIGLSVVKRAIERMGGQVGVQSTPGQGSTFWFQLAPA